ncbi:hypothetical protein [Deinococcus apachensis]|nr:hypothetical protein [Deinococcus apachensis]
MQEGKKNQKTERRAYGQPELQKLGSWKQLTQQMQAQTWKGSRKY